MLTSIPFIYNNKKKWNSRNGINCWNTKSDSKNVIKDFYFLIYELLKLHKNCWSYIKKNVLKNFNKEKHDWKKHKNRFIPWIHRKCSDEVCQGFLVITKIYVTFCSSFISRLFFSRMLVRGALSEQNSVLLFLWNDNRGSEAVNDGSDAETGGDCALCASRPIVWLRPMVQHAPAWPGLSARSTSSGLRAASNKRRGEAKKNVKKKAKGSRRRSDIDFIYLLFCFMNIKNAAFKPITNMRCHFPTGP